MRLDRQVHHRVTQEESLNFITRRGGHRCRVHLVSLCLASQICYTIPLRYQSPTKVSVRPGPPPRRKIWSVVVWSTPGPLLPTSDKVCFCSTSPIPMM